MERVLESLRRPSTSLLRTLHGPNRRLETLPVVPEKEMQIRRGTRIRIVDKTGAGTGSALNEYRSVRFEVPTASIVYTYTDEAPMLATRETRVSERERERERL